MSRKDEHLDICLSGKAVNLRKSAGFEDVKIVYDALPELSINDVNTSCNFLGRKMSAPFYIDAMTGGSEKGGKINKAIAAARKGGDWIRIGLAKSNDRESEIEAYLHGQGCRPKYPDYRKHRGCKPEGAGNDPESR
jgi:isopentenyl diphosphate isomerase/L-lactate dehydrogenase-like FMN-dependent dehydrogenase